MRTEIFEIDQNFLSALVNGDTDGLSRQDEVHVNEFIDGLIEDTESVDFSVPEYDQDGFLNEPRFARCDVSGLYSDVVEVHAIIR